MTRKLPLTLEDVCEICELIKQGDATQNEIRELVSWVDRVMPKLGEVRDSYKEGIADPEVFDALAREVDC